MRLVNIRGAITAQAAALFLTLGACAPSQSQKAAETCSTNFVILGNAQDAGKPQIGNHDDPAWRDPKLIAPATSAALIDAESGKRFLFDASPDIKAQLFVLSQITGDEKFKLDGIFLTHGHIGHYLGLAFLGREAMGANGIPVFAMPRMAAFLRSNGPWDQLVELGNIVLKPLSDGTSVKAGSALVTPFLVPHRGEYTETVGYRIEGGSKSAIYLPDIDSWDEWAAQGTALTDVIKTNDFIFIDGTFYNGDELPGRDMSKIPHPTMVTTMTRLKSLEPEHRRKVYFIHLNHTNPAFDRQSEAFGDIELGGYKIAAPGQRHCLD